MRLVQFLDPADGQHLGVIDRDLVIDVTQQKTGEQQLKERLKEINALFS